MIGTAVRVQTAHPMPICSSMVVVPRIVGIWLGSVIGHLLLEVSRGIERRRAALAQRRLQEGYRENAGQG